MKFMILAYHPNYVRVHDIEDLANFIEKDFDCHVYLITHVNNNADPIYCIQLVDTKAIEVKDE